MSEQIEAICIGGPFDGKRLAVKGSHMHAPKLRQMPVSAADTAFHLSEMTIEHVSYRLELFRTEDFECYCYIQDEISLPEAMRRLFNRYTSGKSP